MKSVPMFVWLVPAAVLAIATARLPYGYYTFTRIVTCGAAGLIAFAGFQGRPTIQAWSVVFAAIAILFNPFLPVHLSRSAWFYLDLATASLFIAHLFLVRQRLDRP